MRGSEHSQRRGKTLVLQADGARPSIDAIDVTSYPGLRDRALIGVTVYTFARVGAVMRSSQPLLFLSSRYQGTLLGWQFVDRARFHHRTPFGAVPILAGCFVGLEASTHNVAKRTMRN